VYTRTIDEDEQGGRFGRLGSAFGVWSGTKIYLVSCKRNNSFRIRLNPILRLVTLAAQNALLSLVMHYSRVSTTPSEAYSAGTAVLMVELFKGTISLTVAYLRIDNTTTYNIPGNAPTSWPSPLSRLKKLGREIFKSDCWKLSVPAILYGTSRPFRSLKGEP